MRKVWIVAVVVAASLASVPAAQAADSLFTENVASAIKQAKAEGKDLFWHFTGSDWCPWCVRLEKEVYDHDVFKNAAKKSFVLIKLDFPRSRKLSDEVKKQNTKWKNTFGVTGFPTIYLTDADQRPYARTGYRRGGAEKYVEHLKKLQDVRIERDKAFAAAAKAKGLAKAKLLDKGLSVLPRPLALKFYKDEINQIAKLDAKNEAGLKRKWTEEIPAVIKIMGEAQGLARRGQMDAAVAKVDAGMKEYKPTGETAQELYFLKATLLFRKDKPASKVALENALKAAPDSEQAGQIKEILAKFFKS